MGIESGSEQVRHHMKKKFSNDDIEYFVTNLGERNIDMKFLKHIERCKSLLHLIDVTNLDLNESYNQVKNELKSYSAKLLEKKELIVLNKIDLIDEETANEVIDHFSKGKNCEIMTMTTLKKESVSKIKAKLLSYVS